MKTALSIASTFCIALGLTAAEGPKPAAMDELLVRSANSVRSLQVSEKAIPEIVLKDAVGVAIAKVTRGGFIVGGQGGTGVVIKKLGDDWSAPSAFKTGGASFGAQIGGESVEYVFVLNTENALEQFSTSKVELDAKASATAGPDHAAAANEKLPESDIYVYAMSDGAFAGATIGGMWVEVDTELNNEVYSNKYGVGSILDGSVEAPAGAQGLYEALGE